jgi:type IV pilus assembly protein PilW
MNTYTSKHSRQGGFSLVEIMIGLLIGLFLMGGLLQVFDHSKRGYKYQEGLSQVQEQGRFAMEFLTVNLRVAGFPGSNPPAGNKIQGVDNATDMVTVLVTSTSDCRNIATGGVAQNIFRINLNNLECSGDGVNWEVFVQDIEDMQILYGEDLDADGVANRYLRANQNPTWNNVVSARVALLARSADFMTRTPESFVDLTGNTVNPNDQRLRRSFISMINLRN